MCYVTAMKQRLITQKDFSVLAGVSGAAVSKATRKGQSLNPARVGRKIDAAHPAARKYVAKRQAVNGTGPDPLYEVALGHCLDAGKFTQAVIADPLGISRKRAGKILDAFRADGLLPEREPPKPEPEPKRKPKPKPKPVKPRTVAPKEPHVRGTAAAKAKRIAEIPIDQGADEIPENIRAFLGFTLQEIFTKFGTDERFSVFLSSVQKIEAVNEKRLKSDVSKGLLVSRELVDKEVIAEFNAAHLRLMTDGAKSLTAGILAKHAAGVSEAEIVLYASDVIGTFIKQTKKRIGKALDG